MTVYSASGVSVERIDEFFCGFVVLEVKVKGISGMEKVSGGSVVGEIIQ